MDLDEYHEVYVAVELRRKCDLFLAERYEVCKWTIEFPESVAFLERFCQSVHYLGTNSICDKQ